IYVTLGLEEKADAMTDEVDESSEIKPQKKKKDPGYNARMAKIAVGNGGLLGQGFMSGPMTRNKFVPERWTDFIFSVIAEEWGFIGSTLVIGIFVVLIIRIISLAERQRSQFSRIYGYCVASIFFLHLLINVGMVIGLAPIIGIPLPFMSYGGSSLIAFTLLLFIFLRLDAERLSIFR
ncbi:MAG: rod shape-determining protein RodA, partial [Flavobacteriales bacterium]